GASAALARSVINAAAQDTDRVARRKYAVMAKAQVNTSEHRSFYNAESVELHIAQGCRASGYPGFDCEKPSPTLKGFHRRQPPGLCNPFRVEGFSPFPA